jgi:hypothetical protein
MKIDSFKLNRRSFFNLFLGLLILPLFNLSKNDPDSSYVNYYICEWYAPEELDREV